MKVVTKRLTTTNAAKTSAQPTSSGVGSGNLHAEADKEKGDEEIAQARDFGRDIEGVGEGRERHARDERAHFAREMQPFAELADQKAPGERADLHELRRARHAAENEAAGHSG